MAHALRSEDWLDQDLPGEAELPWSDGEPMENPDHPPQIFYLVESLRVGWAHRDDFYVGGNMFLYFSPRQVKNNDFRGPDLFVVLDTERRRFRHSWVVWQEHRTPNLVIELLSPSTVDVDRVDKMKVYARDLRVDDYFLYDTDTGLLEGYRLDHATHRYVRMAPHPSGRLYSPALDLWLGPVPWEEEGHRFMMLRWFDNQGNMSPTQMEAERQRADRLEAELAALRRRLAADD